ncbi:hypothetical protein [Actinomadura sp. NBRC 104412]|nr:hypothetical protein [Actinomadura sp. NBRC 104412]
MANQQQLTRENASTPAAIWLKVRWALEWPGTNAVSPGGSG